MATATDPNRLTEQDELEDLYAASPDQAEIEQGIDKLGKHANSPPKDRASMAEKEDLRHSKDLYQPDDDRRQGKGFVAGLKRRKQAAIGGGLAVVLTAGGFGIFTFLQGPFQFIHFAQVLQAFHLDGVTEFTDNRGWKLIEWARTRDAPSRRNLGFLGDRFADKYEADLERAGMALDFTDPNGRQSRRIQGFIIDPNTPEGQSVIQRMRAKGVDPGDFIDIGEGKVRISLRGSGGTIRARQIIGGATEAIDLNRIAAKLSRVTLVYRAGVDMKPFKNKAREKGQDTLAHRRQVREEEAERHRSGADVDRRSTSGTREDPNGDGTIDTDTNELADRSNGVINEIAGADTPKARRGLAGRLVSGGAALALAGAMCTVHDLGKGYEEYQHTNIDLVLERMGMNWSAKGGQVQSNIDLHQQDELAAHNDALFDESAPEGEKSVFSARSVQAVLGQPLTGPDISEGSRPSNAGEKPVIFQFADAIPGIDQGCGVRDAAKKVPILGRFLDFVDDASEFVINTGLRAFGLSMEELVTALYDIFANGGVDVMAQGASLGNLVNHGMRLVAIDDFTGKGGRELSDTEDTELRRFYARMDDGRFEAQSLWARLFDPYERRSLVAKAVLERPNLRDPKSSYLAAVKSPLRILPGLGKTLASLALPSAYAQSQTYAWGYDLFGYSVEELERIAGDDSLDNPYDNAAILEANNGQLLREGNSKWGKCFGSTINPETGEFKAGKTVNRNKLPDECRDNSTEFLRYRLYLADKQAELAYSCYEGDAASCNAIGFGSQTIGGDTGPVSDGTCDPRAKSLGQADGYEAGSLRKIQVCAIPNLSSGGQESTPGSTYYVEGAEGKAIVNASISKTTFDMAEAAQRDGVTLSAGSTFRTQAHQQALYNAYQAGTGAKAARPGFSNHQMGVAIDFDISKCPTRIGGKCAAPGEPEWDWLNVNASRFGFSQYSEEAWHWSTTGN